MLVKAIMAPAISTTLIRVHSPAFLHEDFIPARFTCEGEDIHPPLELDEMPAGARSMVLIMEDPDAPGGTFDHWIAWNIPVTNSIAANSNPGISGTNGFGKTGYGGPCPPSGTHRYFFRVYALDTTLDLPAGARKNQVLEAMEDHVLAMGELMGKYQKKS